MKMRRVVPGMVLTAMFACAAWAAHGEENKDADKGTLIVRVKKVENEKGRVCVRLFDEEKGFPSEKKQAAHRACAPIKGKKAVVVFKDIPFGTYAAFTFHDEDKDGLVRKNWLGMPKEGVGASRGAGGIGGPSFEDARFAHKKDDQAISISLKYL